MLLLLTDRLVVDTLVAFSVAVVLTVTLLFSSESATFVPADIDLRMLPLSSGVPVTLARSVSCFVDKSFSCA